jgi:hypothetical protein
LELPTAKCHNFHSKGVQPEERLLAMSTIRPEQLSEIDKATSEEAFLHVARLYSGNCDI